MYYTRHANVSNSRSTDRHADRPVDMIMRTRAEVPCVEALPPVMIIVMMSVLMSVTMIRRVVIRLVGRTFGCNIGYTHRHTYYITCTRRHKYRILCERRRICAYRPKV